MRQALPMNMERIKRLSPACEADNDCLLAKRRKAFRRAASRLSAAAWLQRHIVIAMSIARMILRIIRRQTCRLAAKSIESLIDFAMR